MEFANDIDPTQLGTGYTETGHEIFSTNDTPFVPQVPPPCRSGQEFIPPHGCTFQCTPEQLRAANFIPSPDCPPHIKHPIPERINREQNLGVNYTANIKIRCLDPPPLPPPGKLTIVEVRPPTPPSLPPIRIRCRPPERPRTPSPIIFREHPPSPPDVNPHEICHVRLNPSPAPPRQVICEQFEALPPKPRDIIVERWLPYKLTIPRNVEVVRARPCKPQTVRDSIIIHTPKTPRIVHQIEKDPNPTLTNPDTYIREHGPTLLRKEEVQTRLFKELSNRHVSEDILQRLQRIFQVPCNQNDESIGYNKSSSNSVNGHGFQQPTNCESILRSYQENSQASGNQNFEPIDHNKSYPNSLNNNVFQQPLG